MSARVLLCCGILCLTVGPLGCGPEDENREGGDGEIDAGTDVAMDTANARDSTAGTDSTVANDSAVGEDSTAGQDSGVERDSAVGEDSSVTLPDVGNCSSTHRKVGWTAELETKSHGVSGTAKIVDDCTIVVDNFSYDGGGVVVEFWGTDSVANGTPDFTQGYALSENIKGTSFDNERYVITLSDESRLDGLKAISVWCTDFNADFGSGVFSE